MTSKAHPLSRRTFLTGAATTIMGAALSTNARAAQFKTTSIQVWSCGGLAEAFRPANARFKEKTGVDVAYTGAFAAALGKSLLGSATTDVFGARVLGLAQKLRQTGKMVYFKPLCFTRYVLVTPKGNPAGIQGIADLAREGVRVIQAPEASPPGGQAATALMKKAGVLAAATKNTVLAGTCVQRTMQSLVEGEGDVAVVEYRLTRMPLFKDKTEILPIPAEYFPPPPLTFTIGVMKTAPDRDLADAYVDFIRSAEGQQYFENAGFIPAISAEGQRLVEKLGVVDV
ncbi:molybdate ABC transporter substrate-binding protein [Desulfosarcina cetonica]